MSVPTLAPEVALATNPIRKIFPLPEGGFALTTSRDDVELFDSTLGPTGKITGVGKEIDTLLPVKTGFLVRGANLPLHEGTPGGALSPTKLGKENCRALIATPTGFIALGTRHYLCESDGNRSLFEAPGRLDFGGTSHGDGAVTAGKEGLAFLSRTGEIVKQTLDTLSGPPVTFANGIVCDDAVMNRDASIVARLPLASRDFRPFRAGLLLIEKDPAAVSYRELQNSTLETVWRFAEKAHLRDAIVVGDRIVVCCDTHTLVLDASGKELARLELPGWVWAAVAFGSGIAFHVAGSRDLFWWREGQEALVPLRHDVQPSTLSVTAQGLASSEEKALYEWRPDREGPEHVPDPSPLPLGTPLVVNGDLVTIQEPGRILLRAVRHDGVPVAIPRDASSRPAVDRPRAREIVKQLINRKFDDTIPGLVTEAAANRSEAYLLMPRLRSLPPEEMVSLVGRSLFAPAAIPEGVRPLADSLRAHFLDELGAAVGVSRRVLNAAIRARRLPLEPPTAIAGHEYLGRFTSGDTVYVCDPCYVRNNQLRINLAVHVGTWHVFVRNGSGEHRNRTAELVVVHELGFNLAARRKLGNVSVDSGNAGVFDKSCPKPNLNEHHEEGIFDGRAAFSSTGLGDGMYPAYAGDLKGRVAKVRIHFLGGEPNHDLSLALQSTKAAKPYAIGERFALGDAVEHTKYGVGTVVEVGTDDKIAVRFPDGTTRRLIHGKG
jgi:hypothetical protein